MERKPGRKHRDTKQEIQEEGSYIRWRQGSPALVAGFTDQLTESSSAGTSYLSTLTVPGRCSHDKRVSYRPVSHQISLYGVQYLRTRSPAIALPLVGLGSPPATATRQVPVHARRLPHLCCNAMPCHSLQARTIFPSFAGPSTH